MEGANTAKGRCKVDSVAALARTSSFLLPNSLGDPTAIHRTVGFGDIALKTPNGREARSIK